MDSITSTQPAQFDYAVLPAEVAGQARLAAERIRTKLKRTAQDIVEIGRDLAAQKEALPHGQFGAWLNAEFDMSQQTAVRMMQVAERFGGQIYHSDKFAPTLLYALAAPQTPQEVVQQAVEAAESGEKVTLAQVEEWKARALAAEEAARAVPDWQQRSEDWRSQYLAEREKARQLQMELDTAPPEKIVEKIVEKVVEKPVSVVPADYDQLRDKLEQAAAELQDLRRQAAAVGEAKHRLGQAQREINDLRLRVESGSPSQRHKDALAAMRLISGIWGDSRDGLTPDGVSGWLGVAEYMSDLAKAISGACGRAGT